MDVPSTYPVIDLAKTGSRIERCRREAGLTVRELQAYFGFEYPQAIYKWQRGACLPTVDSLLALSRLLRVPMEDLLVYDDREVLCVVLAMRIVLQGASDARAAIAGENARGRELPRLCWAGSLVAMAGWPSIQKAPAPRDSPRRALRRECSSMTKHKA